MISSILFKGSMIFNSIYYGNGLKQIGSYIRNTGEQATGDKTTSGTTAPWSFLETENKGGAFDSLATSIENSGASLKRLVLSFAISVATAAVIIFGLQLVLGKNGAKKQELKDHLPWLILGIVLIIGFTLVFSLASSIVSGIEGDLG